MAETEVFLAEREPAVKPRSVKLLSMFERSTANERPSDCVPAMNTQAEDRTNIVPYRFGNYNSHLAFALRRWRINCLVGVALGRFIDHPKPR